MTIKSPHKPLLHWTAGLCLAAILCLFAMAGADERPAPNKENRVFLLEYNKNQFPLIQRALPFHDDFATLTNEPEYKSHSITKNYWKLGEDGQLIIPWAWDRKNGLLYVDANHNGDLTDDGAPYENKNPRRWIQEFKDVTIFVPAGDEVIPYNLSLRLHPQTARLIYSTMTIDSSWSSEIVLDGVRLRVIVSDDMDGVISRSRGSNDALYIEERERFFKKLENRSYHNDPILVKPPDKLFLNGSAWDVGYEFVPHEKVKHPMLKLSLTPATPERAKLRIIGEKIRRLTLEGDWTAILEEPESVVALPAGAYTSRKIYCENDKETNQAWASANERIFAAAGDTIELKAGGPLNNSAKVRQSGPYVNMNYLITGGDGLEYEVNFQNYDSPPRVQVFHGDETLYSGKFEYG